MNSDKSKAIYLGRSFGIGLDMYFYNIRSLMIFKHEILYQLEDGKWSLSSSKSPKNHYEVWKSANLFLTSGKENVRTVSDFGCVIPKNNYNLKLILDNPNSYERIKSIGKVTLMYEDCGESVNPDMKELLDNEIYEFHEILGTYDTDEGIESITRSLPDKLRNFIDEDFIIKYNSVNYSDRMMRDDLGMIQNTMRKNVNETQFY